jgi:A/G-specific adenine glycosylase
MRSAGCFSFEITMPKPSLQRFFTQQLLLWNREVNQRQMPWKGEKDPYKIWLSEIILQQTRVEQGLDYYNKFVTTYPSIQDLATAQDDQVFKLWEGLGYYSRCKNLLATARQVVQQYQGIFPCSYAQILALKGIGPYTAAAISSFAYQLPHAVVDGNVYRVLSRFFGIYTPTDSTMGKKEFTALAAELLPKDQPAAYNQALMDFGATICKPRAALCTNCQLQSRCVAYAQKKVEALPIKEKKLTIKNRFFYYLVAEENNGVWVQRRGAGDIWENLYQFILVEQQEPFLNQQDILNSPAFKALKLGNGTQILSTSAMVKQQLTHQLIQACFLKIQPTISLNNGPYQWVNKEDLPKLAFPKLISNFLNQKNVSLSLF